MRKMLKKRQEKIKKKLSEIFLKKDWRIKEENERI